MTNEDPQYELDPVFLNSFKETRVILIMFVLFLAWTVGVSFYLGSESNYVPADPNVPVQTVWGMPHWVFYGVLLPWMVVNVVGVWFCFGFMKDDDLASGSNTQCQDEKVNGGGTQK